MDRANEMLPRNMLDNEENTKTKNNTNTKYPQKPKQVYQKLDLDPRTTRVAHSRFLKGMPMGCENRKDYDKIVTSVWNYDSNTKVLTYGATVFRKTSTSDCWNRKLHLERAYQRFTECPVTVKIYFCDEPIPSAINWYIANDLSFKFGSYSKSNEESNHVIVGGRYFNQTFDFTRFNGKKQHQPKVVKMAVPKPQQRYYSMVLTALVYATASVLTLRAVGLL